jgi:hypothetical protein
MVNIVRDYNAKKGIRRIRHKHKLLVSQMEEEEKKNLGTFVYYLFLPLSFFLIQFFFYCQSHSLSTTMSFVVCSRNLALVISHSGH